MDIPNELRDFFGKVLVSAGVAGSASIVRAIFVPQEGSAWSKFCKIFGSTLFGGMLATIIRYGDPNGLIYRYVDFITVGVTLAANEIVSIWVKKTIIVVITYAEGKLTSSKDNTDGK